MPLQLTWLRLTKLAAALRRRRWLRALVQARVLAASEHRPLFLRRWQTVIDIGANRGQFTLAALELTPARILAFEPLSQAATIFARAIGNEPRVQLQVCAIGPEATEQVLHVSRHDDSSSLLEIGPEQARLYPGTEEAGQQRVRVLPLHALVREQDIVPPALLKLDVQGFEHAALLGCARLLHAFDAIYCECSFVELYREQKLAADVIALLAGHGFSLCGISNPSYDDAGRCIQADLYFALSAAPAVAPTSRGEVGGHG